MENKFIHRDERDVMCISIDFDDTISHNEPGSYPDAGPPLKNAKEVINRLYDAGHQILIWTCRADTSLSVAIDYLNKHGIKYHKINENADISITGIMCFPKHFADIYIDDRGLMELPQDWEDIYDIVVKRLKIKNTRPEKSLEPVTFLK